MAILSLSALGRPVSSLFPEVLSLPHDGIISGAGTRVEFGDKVLRNELLPNELLMQTVPRLEKNGCWVVLEGPEYLSCRLEDAQGREFFRIVKRLQEEYPERLKEIDPMNDRACKITVRISDMEAFEKLVPELSRAFELARYEAQPYTEMSRRGISKADRASAFFWRSWRFRLRTPTPSATAPTMWRCWNTWSTAQPWATQKKQVLEMAPYRTEGMWEDGIYHALRRYGLI